jgi:hypothetical protein
MQTLKLPSASEPGQSGRGESSLAEHLGVLFGSVWLGGPPNRAKHIPFDFDFAEHVHGSVRFVVSAILNSHFLQLGFELDV